MKFELKFEKQIDEARAKNPYGPFPYLWCEPNLAYVFRWTLACACGQKTGFRYDDGCEIAVCSDECLEKYKQTSSNEEDVVSCIKCETNANCPGFNLCTKIKQPGEGTESALLPDVSPILEGPSLRHEPT